MNAMLSTPFLSCDKNHAVSGCSVQLHLSKGGFAEVSQGRQGQQDLENLAQNRMADCFTLRRRITKLKV